MTGTLLILQECETWVPASVVIAALGCTKEEWESAITPYLGRGPLSRDGEMWAVSRFKPTIVQNDGPLLVERALRNLLAFIHDNRRSELGIRQVPNAISLGKACQTHAPLLVSSLLWKLNTLLKRNGNKRIVLDVANLSIAAAHRQPRDVEQVKGEAVALVCGRSWVLQRMNRLDEAKADANKSLELGRSLEWTRNTAYCLKCTGRLLRMEAEQAKRRGDNHQFEDLIGASIQHLLEAITLFPKTDHTAAEQEAEIGDCYSLLGRTYFVQAKFNDAASAAQEATNRIVDPQSKDYADLQILLGDLARERRDRKAAESCYDEAIRAAGEVDAQKSEIAARAWFQKGVLKDSSYCFDKAAEIWKALDEIENAHAAEWQSALVGKRIPKSAIEPLRQESPSVRLEVLRQYDSQMAALSKSFRGRRTEPEAGYWISLISEARRSVALRRVEWV